MPSQLWWASAEPHWPHPWGPQGELCPTGGPQGEFYSTPGRGGPHPESSPAMPCLLMAEPRQSLLCLPSLCAQPCSVGQEQCQLGTGKAELPECRNGSPAAAALDPREAVLPGAGTGIYIANPHKAELKHPGPVQLLLWSWQTQLSSLRLMCLVITEDWLISSCSSSASLQTEAW